MTVESKNLYEILNVPLNANSEEIKFAYKKMVRIYHPDINKSQDAEIKFKLLNNAYNILSNTERRKNYDSLLNISKKEEEIIKPDKNSIIKEIKITDIEQKEGTTRTVNILNTQKCPRCMGKKFLGGLKCAFCKGEGEKKEFKQVEVEIPKNIEENELIYACKVNSSEVVDKNLFLKIKVEKPVDFYFEEGCCVTDISVSLYNAILGSEFEINIPNYGFYKVLIPECSKEGDKIKLNIDSPVNFFGKIKVILPNKITSEEKRLFKKLKRITEDEEKCEFGE